MKLREGFTNVEKSNMMLSSETLQGLKILYFTNGLISVYFS